MNKGGGIFQEWFKNLTILIFTQSFHAIFMVFILKIISTISIEQVESAAFSAEDGMLGLISIGAIWSLTKFEDLIKGIFGIKDSKFLGSIGKNFSHSMASVGSAASMAHRTIEPFKDMKKMKKDNAARKAKMASIRDSINSNEDQMKELAASGSQNGNSTSNNSNYNNGESDDKANIREAEISGNINASSLVVNASSVQGGGMGGAPMDMKQFQNMLNFQSLHEDKTKNEKMLKELELEDKKGDADYKATRRKAFARLGSTLAASAVGLGATDNLGDAAIVANAIDMPLDYISDKKIDSKTYKKPARELDEKIKATADKIRAEGKAKGLSDEVIDRNIRIATRDHVELRSEFDSKIITGPSVKEGVKKVVNTANNIREKGISKSIRDAENKVKNYADEWRKGVKLDSDYKQTLRSRRREERRKAKSIDEM